jgi:hypothetical protein
MFGMLSDVIRSCQGVIRCFKVLQEVIRCFKLFKILSDVIRRCKVS